MGTEAARTVEAGRVAFDAHTWTEAFHCLRLAGPLAPDDLERLAVAAHLIGRDAESAAAWEAAALAWWESGYVHRGTACAFWLAVDLLLHGEHGRSQAWMTRARRILDQSGVAGPGPGFLLAHAGLVHYIGGEPTDAAGEFAEAERIGRGFDDRDLVMFAQTGLGESLVQSGSMVEGIAVLDEAMLAASQPSVSPINVGLAYCAGLSICYDALDMRRAREWSRGLDAWCAAQPDLVPYAGQCLVHRSQVLQADGDWDAALEAADRATVRLSDHPAGGEAHYQQGELFRLRGDLGAAREAYRRASERGRDPQPGLLLLRLAEGRLDARPRPSAGPWTRPRSGAAGPVCLRPRSRY